MDSKEVQKKDLLDKTSILEGLKGEAGYVATRHKVDHKRESLRRKKKVCKIERLTLEGEFAVWYGLRND